MVSRCLSLTISVVPAFQYELFCCLYNELLSHIFFFILILLTKSILINVNFSSLGAIPCSLREDSATIFNTDFDACFC